MTPADEPLASPPVPSGPRGGAFTPAVPPPAPGATGVLLLPPPSSGQHVPSPVRDPAGAGAPLVRWAWALGFLLAVLAFLLASFPARNGDVWAHLAAGRRVLDGAMAAGPRLGPTWLADLPAYLVYAGLGGTGLVLVKALLVAGLALVLLRLSRDGPGWVVPAACTALALLALSTRLLLQPAILSCLFLGLTLWFLRKEEEAAAPGGPRRAPALLPPWQLALLFLVWGNVDAWWVLGPAVVGLVWLGRALDESWAAERPAAGPLLRRAVPLALLAAAGLLNPAHPGALVLPPELNPPLSPFGADFLAAHGRSPAFLAYYPLLGLGLLALAVLPRDRRPWALPWLGLAVLSVLQARTIPFFAVVAGPVLAWGLQAALARRFPALTREGEGGADLGYRLAVVLGVALLVAAWPGWLQAPPFEPRRWAVETSPSLQRAAEQARRWHEEGRLAADDRGLHLAPETAAAFAWFCPEEGVSRDAGLAAAVRGDPAVPSGWAEQMRAARINHVVVYDADRNQWLATLGRLLADPDQWPLLYLEGDLAVFGWRDPARAAKGNPFADWQLDEARLNQLAFHPAADRRAPREPPAGPAEARPWWEALWKPVPPRSLDHEAATLDLFCAEALRRTAPGRHWALWQNVQAVSLIGTAGGWVGPADLLTADVAIERVRPRRPEPASTAEDFSIPELGALGLFGAFSRAQDDAPPAFLYRAVRSARRAVAANPEDARAWLTLGESYQQLLHFTRERLWARRMPELAQLRQAQASAAFNRAVALRPDFARTHFSLARLYEETDYLDLALSHWRTYLKLARSAAPREQEDRLQARVDSLETEVAKRTRSFEAAAAGRSVRERALQAYQLGLKGKARDMLLESDVAAFGNAGTALELELLLGTGRARDVDEWTTSASQAASAALGAPAYHLLRAKALAAQGAYARAEAECVELTRALAPPHPEGEAARPRELIALLVAGTVLAEHPGGGAGPHLFQQAFARPEFLQRVAGLARGLRQDADATVLRGLLLLEEGDAEEAEVAFRVALALWRDEAAARSGAGLDFNGRPIAQACLGWLE
jgi:tetratricopeptide (TPR) repeat protein